MSRPIAAALLALLLGAPAAAFAQERHAVIVFGAPGAEQYAEAFVRWEASLIASLRDRVGFPVDQIRVLSPHAASPAERSTAENVRRTFTRLRAGVSRDDLLLVLLIGHGTVEAGTAKFNLIGPDLDASEWAALVDPVPGRLVFINSTSGSFPFLEELSSRNRIVITATDSNAQRFATVFPELLVKALESPATDIDRNGRLSLWEIFSQTSAAVKQHYEQRGQLATERALLDDNGDGLGREAVAPGQDGTLARTTYLDAEPAAAAADPALAALLARQRTLEEQAEELRLRKPSMPPAQWDAQFEKLMIELARVSRAIRSRS